MDGLAHSLGDLAGTLPQGAAARALRDGGCGDRERAGRLPGPHAGRRGVAPRAGLAGARRAARRRGDIARRVDLKRRQLGRAAALALGIGADLAVIPAPLRAGGKGTVSLAVRGPAAAAATRARRLARATRRWHDEIGVPADAAPFGTLREGYDPLGGNDPIGATLTWTHHGSAGEMEIDPPERVSLAPEHQPSAAEPAAPPSRRCPRRSRSTATRALA